MKYTIIILFFAFFASCSGPVKQSTNYDIANNAIDSILNLRVQYRSLADKAKRGEKYSDLDAYSIYLGQYMFAKMYQMAVNKMEPGKNKDELVRRYNSEIYDSPDDLFPAIMYDFVGEQIFPKK